MILVWVVVIAAVSVLLGASIGFVQLHIDPSEKGVLTRTLSTLAIFIAFCALTLLPVDIFNIKQPVTESQDIRDLYYGIYLVLAAFAFFLLPFAYFLYEEDDGSNQTFPQAWKAAKYSFGILGVALILTIVILCANFQKLVGQSGLERVESAISVMMGLMLAIGLIGYMTYTAYGLAELPLVLFQRNKPSWTGIEHTGHTGELLQINAEIETLQAKNLSRPESFWPRNDRLEVAKLRDRQSQLALLCDQATPRQRSLRISWVGKLLNRVAGCCLGCLSFLIISSLLISMIDRAMNSECGFRCGYESNQLLANPISLILLFSSDYFPLDLIFFSLLMFYLFAATLTGLSHLGVRFLFIKLYSIKIRKTKQNALLMGVWLMMFFLLAINSQTLVLAPHYATFGNQRVNDFEGSQRSCQLEDVGNGCTTSVLWQINNSLFANIPLIGGLSFLSNVVFLVIYVGTIAWVSCSKQRAYLREIDEADDLVENLLS